MGIATMPPYEWFSTGFLLIGRVTLAFFKRQEK